MNREALYTTIEEAAACPRAVSKAIVAAITEAGMVVVPREPTKEMIDQGTITLTMPWDDDLFPPNANQHEKDVVIMTATYKAMLAAAEKGETE